MKTTFCEVIKRLFKNNINFADTKINNSKKNTMNKTILTIILAFTMLMTNATSNLLSSNSKTSIYSGNVINIKLKNDTDEAFSVINAGSGGSYRLSKNTVVTIKMEEGDKLYMYEGGKKGALLLVASSEMDGKVQLVSKL
jgi:hypothetical protein